jgi:2-polyprenyl-3-methyl-5-hydroxy-6-metoxy-1,4-benzoquinol methylase
MFKCEVCHTAVEKITGSLSIGRCKKCGLLQNFEVKPPTSIEGEEFAKYLSAQDLAFEANRRKIVLSKLRKLLVFNGLELSVFDIGTGSGLLLYDAHRLGFQVSGSELSNSAAALVASKYGFQIFCRNYEDFGFVDCQSAVTMFCVLAHTVNPDALLKSIQASLKNGGVLYFHTPRYCLIDSVALAINSLSKGFLNHLLLRRIGLDHRRIYTRKSLNQLLNKSGFNDFTLKPEIGYGLKKEHYFTSIGFPTSFSKVIAFALNLFSTFKLMPRNVYTVYAIKDGQKS